MIDRLRPQLAAVEGAALLLQPAQDITVGGRLSRGQFQYTLQDADIAELSAWSQKMLAKMRTLPELADVATDLLSNAPQLKITVNRDQAARFGISPQLIDDTLNDAFGQRQITQYFTQINTYFVILEVNPESPRRPVHARPDLCEGSAHRHGSAAVDSCHSRQHAGRPVAGLAPEPAPGGHAVVQPAPRRCARPSGRRDPAGAKEIGKPASIIGTFQGNAQAFQTSLSSEPALIGAALIVVYIILGMLYESFIHPLTILSTLPSAGIGALLALGAGRFDLSVVGIIGIILLIGIVKKNGIMLVDFAIAAERDRGMAPTAAIREACLLRFRPILMTTAAAMLAGVPLMLGTGTGSELRQPLGYAMVGGLCAEPAVDALHDADRLSLSRPLADLAHRTGRPSLRRKGRARSRRSDGARSGRRAPPTGQECGRRGLKTPSQT